MKKFNRSFTKEDLDEWQENIQDWRDIPQRLGNSITALERMDITDKEKIVECSMELHYVLCDIEWHYDQLHDMIRKLISENITEL